MKKSKKVLSVLLSLLMLIAALSALAGSASAANVLATGDCGAQGGNLTWTLFDDGVLSITGTGAMADFRETEQDPDRRAPWTEAVFPGILNQRVAAHFGYPDMIALSADVDLNVIDFKDVYIYSLRESRVLLDAVTTVIIGEGVTSVTPGAFRDWNVKDFVLPSTLVDLPDEAIVAYGTVTVNNPNLDISNIDIEVFDRSVNFASKALYEDFKNLQNAFLVNGYSVSLMCSVDEAATALQEENPDLSDAQARTQAIAQLNFTAAQMGAEFGIDGNDMAQVFVYSLNAVNRYLDVPAGTISDVYNYDADGRPIQGSYTNEFNNAYNAKFGSLPIDTYHLGSKIQNAAQYNIPSWIRIKAQCGSVPHAIAVAANMNFETTGHSFGSWTVTTPATATADGVKTRECEYCHAVETDVVPATGASDPGQSTDPGESSDPGSESSGIAALFKGVVQFFLRLVNMFRKLFGTA
ncbi:MAG: hypothetical protein IJS90_00260 [Clostridia bacterium]|nr:hypothetical protein [Clostridia bacterium]